jgi:hypothetical protein
VLGLPFLRAFTLVFDYKGKQIGFGKKLESFGASILGFNPVEPEIQPIVPDNEIIPEEKGVPGKASNSQKELDIILGVSLTLIALTVIAFYTCRFLARRRKSRISFKHAFRDVLTDDEIL